MKQLEILTSYNIPINSAVEAIQYLSDRPSHSPKEYERRIRELVENDGVEVMDKYVRHVYLYLIQETIRKTFNTDTLDMSDLLSVSVRKAVAFVDSNPYVIAGSTSVLKVDVNGIAKPRKGAKKELAKEVYVSKIVGKNMTRKEAIQILVDEVELTPAGASTYYASLKKGTL